MKSYPITVEQLPDEVFAIWLDGDLLELPFPSKRTDMFGIMAFRNEAAYLFGEMARHLIDSTPVYTWLETCPTGSMRLTRFSDRRNNGQHNTYHFGYRVRFKDRKYAAQFKMLWVGPQVEATL